MQECQRQRQDERAAEAAARRILASQNAVETVDTVQPSHPQPSAPLLPQVTTIWFFFQWSRLH